MCRNWRKISNFNVIGLGDINRPLISNTCFVIKNFIAEGTKGLFDNLDETQELLSFRMIILLQMAQVKMLKALEFEPNGGSTIHG